MSDALDTGAPEIAALEVDIAETRQSLDRKIGEIGRRLQPEEMKEELKDAVRRRLDVHPYLGYIAGGLVALGSVMTVRGWQRSRRPVSDRRLPDADLPAGRLRGGVTMIW